MKYLNDVEPHDLIEGEYLVKGCGWRVSIRCEIGRGIYALLNGQECPELNAEFDGQEVSPAMAKRMAAWVYRHATSQTRML